MKKINAILFSLLVIFFSGCSKDDDNNTTPTNPGGGGGITINSDWQYTAKIAGTTFSHVEGVSNFQGSFSWDINLATWPDSSNTSFISGLTDNNSPNFEMDIDLGRISFLSNQLDTADFKAFFHTGPQNYSTGLMSGVKIRWIDANGDFWSTIDGTADQTGSAFSISDVQNMGMVFGEYQVKFKANFNCKLYNSTGQSMTLVDGVYVGAFRNY